MTTSGIPPQDQTIGHKEPCSPPQLPNTRELMPPPPLPLKAAVLSRPTSPSAMPILRPYHSHRPPTPLSEKWVPSSQTQELSLPGSPVSGGNSSDETHEARCRRASQVVPSSQLSERELEFLGDAERPSDARQSHLSPRPSPVPIQPGHTEEGVADDASPDGYVESSQSQFETEITPAWAESIAARREELLRCVSSLPTFAFELSPVPAAASS